MIASHIMETTEGINTKETKVLTSKRIPNESEFHKVFGDKIYDKFIHLVQRMVHPKKKIKKSADY